MHRGLLSLALLAVACGAPERPSRSIDAKVETHEMLLEDLSAVRHPGDGGGRAFIEKTARTFRAGESARFEIVYEAGPLGVDVGGAIVLQPSPFWGWDSPQTEIPEARGFTELETSAEGVTLEPRTYSGMVAAVIAGRKLEEGERVRILYTSPVDTYAESNSPIWIAVDGNGDGVRAVLPDSPKVGVRAGAPARLVAILPTTARPGERVRLSVALLDALGNDGVDFEGEVSLSRSEGLELPETIPFASADRGVKAIEGVVKAPGVYRVRALTTNGLEGESNPLVARESIPRVLWGDLHGHSQLSDGTGTPDDYFRYARDVAGLDVVALTDHDHWGVVPLDQSPGLWKTIEDAARRAHDPGRFVTLLGYEWTSWLHGHRHVLYFDDSGELLSSLDPRYETPALLWEALEGRNAVTFAHHSAGGPISTNWDFVPPEAIEPVTEIVSVHGSSEASDSPGRIYSAVEGNFVRDVLDRGIRFGFIGSGDTHDGHPGLAHLASPSGGLAAIFAEELSRESVLDALRRRSVYATNGPRIWLRVWLDHPELRFAVAATSGVDRVDVVRSGAVVAELPGEGRRELSGAFPLKGFAEGEYVYLRVVQDDGGAAWSSPLFAAAR
jgi:hypothetical protein